MAKKVVRKPAKSVRHVYFFGNRKADGNRTMKDTLGGKGSGLAGNDQRRPAGPSGLHHLHRRLQHLLQGKGQDSGGDQ